MRILLLLALTSCMYAPIRQFNSDEQQDYECYNKLGGEYGYCDKEIR